MRKYIAYLIAGLIAGLILGMVISALGQEEVKEEKEEALQTTRLKFYLNPQLSTEEFISYLNKDFAETYEKIEEGWMETLDIMKILNYLTFLNVYIETDIFIQNQKLILQNDQIIKQNERIIKLLGEIKEKE